ncbi:DUF2158 domain-containing protein [Mesorhizobium sp. M1060]|uniref:YodC family protein n=1 Tax=unclassified Mesorhizobium TaxID=325217 RepID=UPI0003CE7D19|nr:MULTISPECIES: DUF2158 domain-containing protein [unclassified Mesorhizobium]ESX31952.1 hypothetical protein X765_03775 [Mesorhizobium sp. LSHC440B00]ESX44952.1 hypothetical protein X764_03660 [Mesorhizobium sp. LSHC440A00]WJI59305.1 DUF2158 domain-containing protein [Mesorhizobium sp. C432A]
MAETYKAGDIVQLKSGGPDMTVSSEVGGGDLICKWFNQDIATWTPQQAIFKPAELKKA